jgi:nicotinate-nucleotide adenylyltransferase
MKWKGGAWLKPERIGLMGGSFNPIHMTHVAVARKAMEEAALDKVLFLPTGNPPHKRDGLAPASRRLQMVMLALAQEMVFSPRI